MDKLGSIEKLGWHEYYNVYIEKNVERLDGNGEVDKDLKKSI